MNLVGALSLFIYSEATDSHDFIYTALELVKYAQDTKHILSDYKMPVEKIFLQTAIYIIHECQDLYL